MTTETKKKPDDNYGKIIKAASEEFAEKGYEGARVDEIARRARVNKATLYYHVGDKAALYESALLKIFKDMEAELSDNVDNAVTPDKKLKTLVTTIAKNIMSSQFFAPTMLREIASGGQNLPKDVFLAMSRIVAILHSILDKGEKEGVFVKPNILVTHLMIIGALNFCAMKKLVIQQGESSGALTGDPFINESWETVGEYVAETLINGLKVRKQV
ncbi:hypothetical protein MNBD_NITROSPINAE01-1970 [hydrothermal vent metagenome]|uniref:HTH tetR-type domain-containing protein n=1 Tax=hydrothermal vent metagenome TaxID=652676 RepID=A0A3B1C804_9ZZZZ